MIIIRQFVSVVVTLVGMTVSASLCACAEVEYDVIVHNGTVYDGTGAPGRLDDIGIVGDRIAAVGDLDCKNANFCIDAQGLAVAPGFINMLSWAVSSLIIDGKAESDVRQGVTLEVFGEGISMGPLNELTRPMIEAGLVGHPHDAPWTSLEEYLEYLEEKGVSTNVASFVGASTVRLHVLGHESRLPSPDESREMAAVVDTAMQEGAMGVASALIYAPGSFASSDELVALARVVASYDGLYISHIRSESDHIESPVDETIEIASRSGARTEIYHLKIAGRENWPKLDSVLNKIESARRDGIQIGADIYPYVAGATGLDATMPPWVQEGGYSAWATRLRDPATRQRVVDEMTSPVSDWENLFRLAGPDGIVFDTFKNPELRRYLGMSLAEVARERDTSPAEAAIDLVIEDGSRVGAIYFLMSEENIRAILEKPWVTFGSDAPAQAPRGVFLEQGTHPRAYGTFARILGRYAREEGVLNLPEAIHRMTGLPAHNLRLVDRGTLAEGNYADIVVFDADRMQDLATYESPQRFAVGVRDVFVNGEQVLADGAHTGAMPGRVVWGPGRKTQGIK